MLLFEPTLIAATGHRMGSHQCHAVRGRVGAGDAAIRFRLSEVSCRPNKRRCFVNGFALTKSVLVGALTAVVVGCAADTGRLECVRGEREAVWG
jgi:hypothetical protein